MSDNLEWQIARAKRNFLDAPAEDRREKWNIYRDLILSRNAEHRRAKERKLFGRTFG